MRFFNFSLQVHESTHTHQVQIAVSMAVMAIAGAGSASVHPPFGYFASFRSAISYDVSSLLPYNGLLLLLRSVAFCSSIGCFIFSYMIAQGMLTNCSVKMRKPTELYLLYVLLNTRGDYFLSRDYNFISIRLFETLRSELISLSDLNASIYI